MTAATASARGRSNRRRGHDAERAVARWLRTNGWPHAERAVRNGFRTAHRSGADPLDLTGTPHLVWSVKDDKSERICAWMVELAEKRRAAGADVGVLVQRRRGAPDPGFWWAWIFISELVELLRGSGHPEWPGGVVRMELQDLVPMLHAAGYGTPAGQEST
ncbi:hypothetical protein GCM10012275_53350 [Longimycelium tulufanense]|uniref:Uncharacterized protein n=1 Tax=Longimycelium tulufanense TaxID=907463 RepID=A0A8J3CJC6_9PSEU|nr:hypothetical protein [Longimycelium tulufanense]GGM75944.1 hypothetical protein GCM10012275_53350 [Longimycelium tulufanense]